MVILESAHEIIPRIWLGNRYAAADASFIYQKHITVIVNASKNLPFLDDPSLRKYRIPVDDNLQDVEIRNLGRWAPEIIMKIINEYRAGHSILVHCAAGMQRSAAIVAMLLIVIRRMSASDAMEYIKSKRRIAFFPCANFRRSILEFESYILNLREASLRGR